MTESELNEIESRLNNSTKGTWIPMIEGITHESGSDFIMTNVSNKDDYKNSERGQDIELMVEQKTILFLSQTPNKIFRK
jgi:hypothetical protein